MPARLLFVIGLAVAMAACATAPSSLPASSTAPSAVAVALRTWVPSSPEACPQARTEGILVRQPQSGAGLRDNAGAVGQVIWPTDYTARDEGVRLVVLDGGGNVLAREGDRVEIGGAGCRWRDPAGLRRTEGRDPVKGRARFRAGRAGSQRRATSSRSRAAADVPPGRSRGC